MHNNANLLRLLISGCALVFSLATSYYGPTETELRLWSFLPFGRPEVVCQTWSALVVFASTLLLALTASDLWRGRGQKEKGS